MRLGRFEIWFRMKGCGGKVVGAALSVCFLWFLLVVSLGDWNVETRDVITVQSAKSVKFLKAMEIERSGFHQNFNLNFVSKRRVPNGPDPIHNRRVGTTKLPPT